MDEKITLLTEWTLVSASVAMLKLGWRNQCGCVFIGGFNSPNSQIKLVPFSYMDKVSLLFSSDIRELI